MAQMVDLVFVGLQADRGSLDDRDCRVHQDLP